VTSQSKSLMQAWDYSPKDHLLHVLPLHHIHGIINAIITPLFAGSTIEFLFPFNSDAVWARLAAPFMPHGKTTEKITFFTVVPTVYNRLLSTHKGLQSEMQEAARKAISPENLRLNISGSAALPTPTKLAWAELSKGNILLERYGMTEVGMALSCGLGNSDRVDGSVGWPLPSVQVRLVDTESNEVIESGEELDENGKERDGEIQLRGPTIFKEYWDNEKATLEAFTNDEDGQGPWFKTGDIAVRRPVASAGNGIQEWATGPLYFIRGRKSADIIKTGGEKVSALEVERELLSLPEIAEAAVVAVPSGKWGQKVGAVLVLKPEQTGKGGKKWGPMDMRRALRDRLANYKIPQIMRIVDEIPRNAMGKGRLQSSQSTWNPLTIIVNKAQLVKVVFSDEFSGDEL
jgi:malonyl-CoA/methylmalonyl-CoA synthetase